VPVLFQTDIEFLCRCLAPVEYGDGIIGEGIESRSWDGIIKFVDASYLSPALFLGLKRHGLFYLLDQEVQDYFEAIHFLSVDRNRRLRAQGVDLIRLLNRAGIEPLLLKGLAGLLGGLYEGDGERIMTDIDVLIDEADLSKALEVLQENGYHYYQEPSRYDLDMKYKHHAPPLVMGGGAASVELHIRPTILAGKRTLLDAPYACQGAKLIEINSARALMPAPEFRLLHNFFHSQHQDGRNYRFGRIHVRGLLDWVKLRQAFGSSVDWSALVERVRRRHLYRSFSAYLINAEELFGQPLPDSVKPDLSAQIHVQRQKLLLKHCGMAKVNDLCLHLLQGSWHFFSPAMARRRYGDVSMFTAMRLQAGKRMSSYRRGN